jgi:voltage-dependent calcium channel L type alpha-1D
MANDNPLRETTQWQTNLELTFNILFTIEMFMKIIALGFVVGRFSYLRDQWNVLDFIVVTTSWLPLLLSLLGIELAGNMQAIRSFRLLRPLRTVSRFPTLKKLVVAILLAIPQLGNLVVLIALFFITFGYVPEGDA